MRSRVAQLARAMAGLSFLALSSRASAVVSGQVDTFSDGTTGNWAGGGVTPVSGGGPAGISDPFLKVVANGGDGPGSKLITYNRNQWIGDYTTSGVTQIDMDLKAFGSTTLSIRIVFKDGAGQSSAGYATTNAFILPADSAWHHATFSVTVAAMTALSSPGESFNSLIGPGGALAEFRILESASPSLFGDAINASLGIDNVTAASAGPTVTSATWNAGSGNWEAGANWLGGTPAYGPGQTATFADPTGAAPASAIVTLTASQIIGTLAFNGASGGSYTLAATGGSTLNMNNSGGCNIHLVSTSGNVTISAPLVFNNAVTATVDGNTTLSLSGAISGSGGLNKTGTGVLAIAAPASGGGLSPLAFSSLTIGAGKFLLKSAASHADRTLLMPGNLSITGGQLDLGGNDAIFKGISLTAIQTLVKTGYNGGVWNGPGPSITSALAGSNAGHLTAIGVISGVSSFDSRTVLTSDVLAKYTYYGDANLDGRVDGSDYSRIDSGYLSQATGWYNGDFNYDAVVNGSDYTLIDNAFNTQGVALTATLASQIIPGSSVPEPAITSTLLTLVFGLLRSRRRVDKNSANPTG